MRRLLLLAMLLVAPSWATDAKVVRHTHHTHTTRRPPTYQVGVASWYGNREKGHKTANGERFNPEAMTCAHRTLPMNTVIRVTNTSNGRSVLCRVNDRGPYAKHRVLDTTRRIAGLLDYRHDGVTKVRIHIVALNMRLDSRISNR